MTQHDRRSLQATLLGAVYLATAWAVGAGIVDDTYIFLRYARNIWEGAGAVFNEGERVEGYTSPLWLAALTALRPLPFAHPALAVAASAVLGYVTILLVAFWRTQGTQTRLLGALFLASNPSFVFWAWSGMDTVLFTLLGYVAVLQFEKQRRESVTIWTVGFLLASAAVARLEAAWLVPVLAALSIRLRQNQVLRTLVTMILPVLATIALLTLWRWIYYDALVPNTFMAKVGVPRGSLLTHGAAYLLHAAVTLSPTAVLLMPLVRGVRLQDPERGLLLLVCWWAVYVLAVGGDHFALFRFFVPMLPFIALLVDGAARRSRLWESLSVRRNGLARGALVLAANGLVLIGPMAAVARNEVRQAEAWARTGRWCHDNLPQGSIATMVAGAIPYYCERYTVDILGLVDRHIATRGTVKPSAAVGHQKSSTAYVLSRTPRYIFFPYSAQAKVPLFESPENRFAMIERTSHALIELTTHPTTLARYEYRSEQLPDGTWIEYLQLVR